jgi:hypothetical protein
MKMKGFLLVGLMVLASQSFGQFGVMVGPSVMRPFGVQKTFVGFHLGGEYSLDDATSYFGRFTHYLGATDPLRNVTPLQALNATFPYAETSFTTSTNYTCLSGGARYYLGDGYETGLSAYGGSTINLVFNSIKAEFEPYDESKYILPDGFNRKGNAFGFGIGLQGGVKYGIVSLGTIYFDLGLDYLIAYQGSNTMASYSPYLSNILFQFNLGFRKDLFTN